MCQALLCRSTHSHRHFKSVCGCASLRTNSCVPTPSPPFLLCQQEHPCGLTGVRFWLEANPSCTSHTQGGEGRIEVVFTSPCICSSLSGLLGEAVQNYLRIVKMLFEFVFHTATASLPGKAMIWFSLTILSLSSECYFMSSVL